MLPNQEWTDWTRATIADTVELEPTVLLIPIYEKGNPFTAKKSSVIRGLRAALPECLFLYRIMGENNMLRSAKMWANETITRTADLPRGEIIATNEDNLEGMSENWTGMVSWWKEYKANIGSLPIHLPALSPQGNYYGGWAHYAEIVPLFCAIDIHVYPGNEADVGLVGSVLGTHLPVYVTEYNRIMPTTMAKIAQPTADGIVWFILDGTPDQKQFALVEPYRSDFKKVKGGHVPIIVPNFTSPNHGGKRAKTLGVVIHATLSTKNISVQEEYESTINYFQNPASEVSAHVIVGPQGQVHRSVHPDLIAWHALQANQTHWGLEMAKSHVTDKIEPAILDRAAKETADFCVLNNIPIRWDAHNGIEEHRNIPGNNHQDVGGPFDRDDFLVRVKHYAGQGESLTDAQKKAVLEAFDFIWGYSRADQIKVNPAESEKVIHERLISAKIILGING